MLCNGCVAWQSSESTGSPTTPREAWISMSGPFTRLPAPPHITDVSSSLSVTCWFVEFVYCVVYIILWQCYPHQYISAYLCASHKTYLPQPELRYNVVD